METAYLCLVFCCGNGLLLFTFEILSECYIRNNSMRERVYVFNPHQTKNIFFTPTTHKILDFLKPNQYY